MQCCYFYSWVPFHSKSHSDKASLAKDPPNLHHVRICMGRERKRLRRVNKACTWQQLLWSSATGGMVEARTSLSVGTFGQVAYGTFFLKRRKALCSSSDAAAPEPDNARVMQDAQEAVLSVLQEEGLSVDDSMVIISKAPVFIQELVSCIQQLEESGIFTAEGDGNISHEGERRGHIYHLASRSRGMSPFLESLGVPLSSVSKVSYSLSSERLPEVFNKVRYLEELLIDSEDGRKPVDGLVQFMIKHFSLSVWDDEDLQRTFAFFEKIRLLRADGLKSLNVTSYVLPRFLETFPQIFRRSLEDHIKPTIRFLENLGLSRDNLGFLILCFPPILLQDSEKDLLPRKRTLKKVGVRVQDMGRMLVKYPWLLSKSVGNNVEDICTFLETIKVPKSKIDRSITSCPHLLGCSSTGSLTSMVQHINGYGLKSKRLGRVIAQSPKLLIKSPQDFDEVVVFLGSVGLETDDINKLLRRSPEIFVTSITGTLSKKVTFLEGLGVQRKKLGRIIWFFPEVLSMSLESALVPRIQYLLDWRFSKPEIAKMIFMFPPLIGYDIEAVIRPKLEFLTKDMGKSAKDVITYPRYFSHSLQKKIKLRAKVLENRKIECDLRTMLAKSDDAFAAEFLGFETLLLPPIKTHKDS